MTSSRQLHLGAFMRPASIHTGAWRHPGAWPDMNFNFAHIKESIQKLEHAKFDAFFMADHVAVLNMPMDALKRSHAATSFEPFTLLSALSQVTARIEFYDVVTGLWDSWADDAFVRDVENGIFFDPAKMHVLDHKGKYLSVRGPLNIARPVQGWPVIVQAGASEAGRQLAAETAEAVFTAQSDIAAGRQFYADVKGRMTKLGRSRDHLKILPGCFVVVGDTVEEARAKRAKLDSLVHYTNAIGSL